MRPICALLLAAACLLLIGSSSTHQQPLPIAFLQGLLKIADLGVSAELARVFTNVQVG